MHADDMKQHQFFSHRNSIDPARSDPQKRAQMHGVANPNISENINQGFGIRYTPNASVRPLGGGNFADLAGRRLPPHSPVSLADSLLATWMESSGHKKNILDPAANAIGVGLVLYRNPDFHQMPSVYAVQKFQRGEPIQVGPSSR